MIGPLFGILSIGMEDQPSTISAELLSLTYGAFISQIVKDYEDVTEINKQIDLLGFGSLNRVSGRYNMGLRLVEDYLSKTHTRGIKSFQGNVPGRCIQGVPDVHGSGSLCGELE